MKISILSLLLFFSLAHAKTTQVLFDGYYKISLGGQHIGYMAQTFEYDEKAKKFFSVYFLKTNKLGGDLQESVKAASNEKFEPISYSYTSQTGQKVKTIDGTFKGETMKLITTDGKMKRDETHKIPKGTFLSSFLGMLMLQKGISVGKKFSYSAVAEEDGNSYNGETLVKEQTDFLGQKGFRILNKFKGANFISFMNEKGEVLGTKSEENNLSTELVKSPSEATQGFVVPNKTLELIFGRMPTGTTNSLATKGL